MKFIYSPLKPRNRKASYYNPQVQCKVKIGVIIRRIRDTNNSDFTGDCSSYTADLQTLKIHYNAIVYENAQMLTLDLTDFYLGSVLPHPKYMWLTRDQLPPDIKERYNNVIHRTAYRTLVQIDKDIYGLTQAGKLAKNALLHLLESGGYYQRKNNPLLFHHKSQQISFVLVVNEFSVKYVDRSDALQLMSILGKSTSTLLIGMAPSTWE